MGQLDVSSGSESYSGWNCMRKLSDKGFAIRTKIEVCTTEIMKLWFIAMVSYAAPFFSPIRTNSK